MNEPRAPDQRLGSIIVLVGVAGFIVSCFLPYVSIEFGSLNTGAQLGSRSMSLYQLVVPSPVPGSKTIVESIGAFLYLFAGAGIVAWIALAGIRHRRHSSQWTPFALAAAAAAWSVTWIGVVLGQSGFMVPLEVGYWSVLVSLGVVIVGTIVIWVSAKHIAHEPNSAGPRTADGAPLG